MQNELEKNKEALIAECKAHQVKSVYAFGSVVSNDFNVASDIDLLISFEENLSAEDYAQTYFSLKNRLELLLKRNVDLVIERTLRNPYLIAAINKTKQLIYA
jgi:predicted nucleotidyltransferase